MASGYPDEDIWQSCHGNEHSWAITLRQQWTGSGVQDNIYSFELKLELKKKETKNKKQNGYLKTFLMLCLTLCNTQFSEPIFSNDQYMMFQKKA